MEKDLEIIIEDGLLKDKYRNLIKKNKKIIIVISFLLIFVPIIFQIYLFIEKNKNEKIFLNYLKAEFFMEKNEKLSVELLNDLKNQNNDTIKMLSSMMLHDYYLKKNDNKNLLLTYEELKKNIKFPLYKDLVFTKNIILNFDTADEEQILKYTDLKNNYFQLINKKILYDFYIKEKQVKKADEVLKNLK